jgi:peptidoglycan/xylan/chitin deacetylase (PgdA/CDA1 family)
MKQRRFPAPPDQPKWRQVRSFAGARGQQAKAFRSLGYFGVLIAVALAIGPVSAAQASPAHLGRTSQRATGSEASPSAARAGGRTVVTFTWGGGFANQLGALPSFQKYRMHATFYVPSGLVCLPNVDPDCTHMPYLSLSQVRRIAANGNEIGGLSVEHIPLNKLPAAEAEREICDDRVNLTRWGFRVTDFAYPFALVNHTLQVLAKRCGYNSGLGTGQLRGAGLCGNCPWAESIPPQNPFVLRTPIEVASVGTSWSPATFQKIVTGAEQHGGGWIIFTIHDVCRHTCSLGVTVPELDSVLAWLSRQSSRGVTVKTVAQVVGGPLRPARAGPRAPRIPPPGVRNARLTHATPGGAPVCYQTAHYGMNHAIFRYSRTGGPGGAGAEFVSVSHRVSGTAQLLPTLDLGECAPSARPGRSYRVAASYKSSAPLVFNVYYRTSVGTWQFWATSPQMAASKGWTAAHWTAPALPGGASGVSFGLALTANGTMATSRYSLAGGPAVGDQPSVLEITSSAVVGAALLVFAGFVAAAGVRRVRHRGDRPGQERG